MILVSACLCGETCRYDGTGSPHPDALALLQTGKALPICPEVLGGLPTPRPPAEIRGGAGVDVLDQRARIYDQTGRDVTAGFLKGAEAVLRLCELHGVKQAILKSKSPSCGCGHIYDGSFTGRLAPGDGVTAALLKRRGIEVRAL